jgi:hypothetical protein
MIALRNDQERDLTTLEVCRKHNILAATLHKMTAKLGGLNSSDARWRWARERDAMHRVWMANPHRARLALDR